MKRRLFGFIFGFPGKLLVRRRDHDELNEDMLHQKKLRQAVYLEIKRTVGWMGKSQISDRLGLEKRQKHTSHNGCTPTRSTNTLSLQSIRS